MLWFWLRRVRSRIRLRRRRLRRRIRRRARLWCRYNTTTAGEGVQPFPRPLIVVRHIELVILHLEPRRDTRGTILTISTVRAVDTITTITTGPTIDTIASRTTFCTVTTGETLRTTSAISTSLTGITLIALPHCIDVLGGTFDIHTDLVHTEDLNDDVLADTDLTILESTTAGEVKDSVARDVDSLPIKIVGIANVIDGVLLIDHVLLKEVSLIDYVLPHVDIPIPEILGL